MIIDKGDKIEFEYICKLNIASGDDVLRMVNLCEKYKMRGCRICKSCASQILNLHKKIKDYYAQRR